MSDWLLTLVIQIGGIGAVSVIVKWLLAPISTALNSYVAGYTNQTASIHARFANLERLAEEQAHITRTVETIRDEISMQAKSRDNRWAYRKDVYTNLITVSSELVDSIVHKAGIERLKRSGQRTEFVIEQDKANLDRFQTITRQFITWTNLAPLARADDVNPLIQEAKTKLGIDFNSVSFGNQADVAVDALNRLIQELQLAGRKALWESD